MLNRASSDFQWFKERLDQVHLDLSSPVSGHTDMATTHVPAGLNPETSEPEQRAEHDLPPKSYVDAVIKPEEQQQEENKNGHAQNGNIEINSNETAGNVNGFPPSQSNANATKDITSNSKPLSEADWLKPAKRPRKSLSELNRDFEASTSITTPIDLTRKATSNISSSTEQLNWHTESTRKDTVTATSDDKKKTSYEDMVESIQPTEKANFSGMNGTRKEDKIVYEKYTDNNGTTLTSVKPNKTYEEGLKHDEKIARSKPKAQGAPTKLASGRRAGAGWETSAIRWAPLNVPLQRRLQTMAVLWHTTAMGMLLSLFFLVCAVPLAWPLLIPYLIYTLIFSDAAFSGTLSRRSRWVRESKFWSLFASYFPARLHRTVELEPTRKYIFGYHPHGIISHGAFAAFGTEALGFRDLYPGITNTLLTLDANFRVPFYRDYALALGLASVSRESIENILSKGGLNGEGMGRAVTIVIGGARESLDAKPHSLRLVLKSRKGFIKLAIRTGADLVPVLAFGENDLYEQVNSEEHPWIHNFQLIVKKLMGFTIPLFHARGVFNYDVGLMPYRLPINVVVGKPIQVVQQGGKEGSVDPQYLDQLHKEYVDELVRLWDSHKDTFARDRAGELEIVE